MNPLGLGIVGYGSFGKFTTKAYAQMPQVQVVAITDVDRARRDAAASLYRARAYDDLTQLLADPAVDIVVINTPPWLHASQARQAAEAGKHIFLEKPLATTLEDADTLIEILKARNIHLTIDYVLRYVPIYDTLQKLTQSELLGKVTYMHLENVASNEALHSSHWFWDHARSGGIFIEHGVHFFDLCNQLSKSNPTAVTGYAHTSADGRQDRVMSSIIYSNGILANFYHAFDRPAILEQTVLRVVMERGSAVVHGWIPDHMEIRGTLDPQQDTQLSEILRTNIEVTEVAAPEGITGATTGRMVRASLTRNDRTADYTNAVKNGLAEFINVIQDPNYKPRVTLQDVYDSFHLAFLSQQSIEQGHSLTL